MCVHACIGVFVCGHVCLSMFELMWCGKWMYVDVYGCVDVSVYVCLCVSV